MSITICTDYKKFSLYRGDFVTDSGGAFLYSARNSER